MYVGLNCACVTTLTRFKSLCYITNFCKGDRDLCTRSLRQAASSIESRQGHWSKWNPFPEKLGRQSNSIKLGLFMGTGVWRLANRWSKEPQSKLKLFVKGVPVPLRFLRNNGARTIGGPMVI